MSHVSTSTPSARPQYSRVASDWSVNSKNVASQPASPTSSFTTLLTAPNGSWSIVVYILSEKTIPTSMSDFATKLTTVVHDDDQMEVESAELPPHLVQLGHTEPEPASEPLNTSNEPDEHDPSEPRPGCLLLLGVDELDTRAIKLYIDSFLKP
ncbi:hypothetical protein WICPIJ_006296, partial [Wickerhamomyces pijperi]